MKRPILLLPLPAWMLAMVMFGGSAFLFFALGSWLLPIAITVAKRGWSAICEIPIEMHIFPTVPRWIDAGSTLSYVMSYGSLFVGAVVGFVGLVGSIRFWRCLVVRKFHWMTEEQVDAFLKRVAEKG